MALGVCGRGGDAKSKRYGARNWSMETCCNPQMCKLKQRINFSSMSGQNNFFPARTMLDNALYVIIKAPYIFIIFLSDVE